MAQKVIEVATLRHRDKRRNIPTAELEPMMEAKDKNPKPVPFERNHDLDPQLFWRGKDGQDWSNLIIQVPPLYIQEKVHPKVLIDDLLRQSEQRRKETTPPMPDLFADFNGLPDKEAVTEFYQHDANWSNRMILGDSLSVMASLAEREGLRGKVQCIYIDPPYGIRFNSNFQWSTTSRDVKDGNKGHITREPEQVKAFRDTWRDGVHSYLTYLRDRLTVARDLLADGSIGGYSGSIFVQIGEENVHRVRALMDEVFGEGNFVAQISFRKKLMPLGGKTLEGKADYLIWYSKSIDHIKYRQLYIETEPEPSGRWTGVEDDIGQLRRLAPDERDNFANIPRTAKIFGTVSQWAPSFSERSVYTFQFQGVEYCPTEGRCWVTTADKMDRLSKARRLFVEGDFPRFISFHADFCYRKLTHPWRDTAPAQEKRYAVETSPGVIERCVLMTTEPGDLVLDPTCGSGTTAYVAEQWGRRWITIDTSRVALALARARIMGARYPYYLLADSPEGQRKEAEVSRTPPKETPTRRDIRLGFVYERVPHITLKSIANNTEIDVIWEKWQQTLEPLRAQLNAATIQNWQEWEIPREASANWPDETTRLQTEWWRARIARQKEIDASIDTKAEFEYLYDKPYPDNSRIRVAGPFTVESLSPHRYVASDHDDSLIHELSDPAASWENFGQMVLENLKTGGVQQAHKEDHHLHCTDALARPINIRRGTIRRRQARAPCRDSCRPRIWHRVASRLD
jgi:adenine-specific DNA-methyltransferase